MIIYATTSGQAMLRGEFIARERMARLARLRSEISVTLPTPIPQRPYPSRGGAPIAPAIPALSLHGSTPPSGSAARRAV